ncbi:hypothetical protein BH10BAC5_BH10BAC5_04950 [soil metagenome]
MKSLINFDTLYKNTFPRIRNHILLNKGNTQDAEDIFQESLIILFKNDNKEDFILTSQPSTYIYSVCKNLWLKKLRNMQTDITLTDDEIDNILNRKVNLICEEETISPKDKIRLVFKKITGHCKTLLESMFIHSVPMEDLMKKMGWKNKHTANNQKYKCLQQAKQKSGSKKVG